MLYLTPSPVRFARVCCALLLVLLSAPMRARAEGVAPSPAPVQGEPLRCYSPGDDVYCLMSDHAVRSLRTGQSLLQLGSGQGFTVLSKVCDVGPGPSAACLYTEQQTQGKSTHYQLVLARSGGGAELLFETRDQAVSALPRGIYANQGTVIAAYTTHDQRGGHAFVYVNGRLYPSDRFPRPATTNTLNDLFHDRGAPQVDFFSLAGKLWIAGREDEDLVVSPVDDTLQWTRVAEHSIYDMRTVVGGDGYVYIFYHDSKVNAAMVATSHDGTNWRTIQLDQPESGWQIDAAPAGLGVTATWYYRRNTYNQGLRSAFFRDGQLLQPAHTLVRSGDHNAGWGVHLGTTADGTTWLTWQSDVLKEERAWAQLKSPLDLAEVRIKPYRDWRDHAKFWELLVGAGGWYTLWHTEELALDTKDSNGVKVGKADRNLANTILLTGTMQARLWDVQLALGYAQSIVDAASEAAGNKFASWFGSARFDRIFPGHDVQVRGAFGQYRGSAKPGSLADADETGPLRVDTSYWLAQALAISKWRIKYGLSYGRFTLPTTVHAFSAAEGATAYRYAGSYFRSVKYDDIRLLLGYSWLDYLAHHENRYFGPIIDGDVLIGGARMQFAKVQPAGEKSDDVAWGLSVGGHAEVGWMWMQRLRALAGLGIYTRLLYRGELDGVFGLGKPDDREAKQAKARDTKATASLISVRHGPWLDVGLVW